MVVLIPAVTAEWLVTRLKVSQENRLDAAGWLHYWPLVLHSPIPSHCPALAAPQHLLPKSPVA